MVFFFYFKLGYTSSHLNKLEHKFQKTIYHSKEAICIYMYMDALMCSDCDNVPVNEADFFPSHSITFL